MPLRAEHAPSEQEIRERLLRTAAEFGRITGASRSSIGLKALNDTNILFRIEAGEDFKMSSYRRLTEFLRRNWPRDTVPRVDGRDRTKSTRVNASQ